MARKAEFSINGLSVMAELKKVDRKKDLWLVYHRGV